MIIHRASVIREATVQNLPLPFVWLKAIYDASQALSAFINAPSSPPEPAQPKAKQQVLIAIT